MNAPPSPSKVSVPKLTAGEKRGLRDYWGVYEAHREEISAQLLRMAGEHPEFKFILQNTPSQPSASQNGTENELQRQAIFNDEWEPYLKSLQLQGMHYAQAGLSFHAWFEIVGAFRKYMVPHLLDAYGKSSERLLSSINGVDRLIEIAMSVIGESYLETKEQLIHRQEKTIQRSQEQLAGIINSAMDAIISIDEKQHILIFNPAAEKMFQRFADKVIGKPLTTLIPERLRLKHEEDVSAFGKTSVTKRSMGRLGMVFGLRANGEEFPLEASISQFEIDGGKTFTAILRDVTERLRAEETLRASEERFHNVLDNMLEGFQIIGFDWKYIYVNDAVVKQGQWRRAELLGHTMMEVYPGIEETALFTALGTCMHERRPQMMEYEFTYPDGSTAWFQLVIQPAPEGIIILSSDITKRKRAEQELQQSEERFATAFRSSPTPITLTRLADGKIADVNEAFCRLFGYAREEAMGHTSRELGIDDPESRLRAVEHPNEKGAIQNLEQRARNRNGVQLNILNSIETISLNGESYALTTIIDITDRKRAETALQKAHDDLEIQVQERTAALSQANALLQMLLDHSPDHIFFKDLQGRFIRTSRSQAQALGLSNPAEIAGKSDFDFFPHAQKSYEDEQEIIRSGKPLVGFEERVVWPDGRETWGLTTKVPLRNESNNIIGTFGIFKDITQRKQAEEALEKAKAELEATNKELEAFSYSVSHDLRAPLRSIDGFSRILLEDYGPKLDAEAQRYLRIVRENTRQMGQLIEDLLTFARIGRQSPEMKVLSPADLARQALAGLQAEQEGRQVEIIIGDDLPPCRGDPSLLKQVFVNLLANALKFTRRRQAARIEIGGKSSDGENVYFVKDNGAGFDMKYANKLFGVFQRLHRAEEYEGTGVGLAIVQRVVHRHGGRVWAEAEVDRGATFYFTLPGVERVVKLAPRKEEDESIIQRGEDPV
jgi:PAS domain S-box-containing protein